MERGEKRRAGGQEREKETDRKTSLLLHPLLLYLGRPLSRKRPRGSVGQPVHQCIDLSESVLSM